MNLKSWYLLFVVLTLVEFTNGQIDSSKKYIDLPNDHISRVIVDGKSNTKIILDTTHIYIEAINHKGARLWRTDPWKDNKLMVYRVRRPRIVDFYLENDKKTGFVKKIAIAYDNTQFGFLDLDTGKFSFYGQD